jgi:hypothetical protein
MSSELNAVERFALRREAMKYFQKVFSHPTTYIAALATVVSFLTPSIHQWLAVPAHANSTIGVLVAAAVAALHAMPPGSGGSPSTPVHS